MREKIYLKHSYVFNLKQKSLICVEQCDKGIKTEQNKHLVTWRVELVYIRLYLEKWAVSVDRKKITKLATQ